MNALTNKVQLIGRLGTDPDVKTFDKNVKRANLSIATNEYSKNDNGECVEKTTWHKVVVWRGLADVAEKYCEKGKEIAVEGKLVNRQYEDKEGKTRYITEVVANDIMLLGKK